MTFGLPAFPFSFSVVPFNCCEYRYFFRVFAVMLYVMALVDCGALEDRCSYQVSLWKENDDERRICLVFA